MALIYHEFPQSICSFVSYSIQKIIVCISDVNTIVFVLSPKARSALYVILNCRYSYAQCPHVAPFAGSIANVSSNQDVKEAVRLRLVRQEVFNRFGDLRSNLFLL